MALELTKEQQELKNSLPALVEIIESHGVDLEEVGREYLGLCPFHDERTPSFRVYQKEDEPALYKCFGCQKSGNIFQFVMAKDKLAFAEASAKIMSQLEWTEDKKEVEKTFHAENKKKKEYITFPLARLAGAEQALEESPEAQSWLEKRGINLALARTFHLGFTKSIANIDANHPWRDKGWIIFPSIVGETIVSVKYRSIFQKKSGDGKISGFLRAPGMQTALFNERAVDPSQDVYLVEGEMDAVAMAAGGYRAVSLPSAGFNLTPAQRVNLLRANRIFLAGDTDPAGQETMHKLWVELRERTYKIDWPTPHKDANDVLKSVQGNVENFKSLVESAKRKALESPMPYMFNLRDTLETAEEGKASDNPRRLRFPWKNIDDNVIVLPGNVMGVMGRETKMGKTSWVQNILLHNAMHYNKVVVNYGIELSPLEYSNRVACQLTKTDRGQIGKKERLQAAELLGDAQFYNGLKPGAGYKEVMDLLVSAKKNLGADIVVVDTLHHITSKDGDRETAAQNDFMRLLKEFAAAYDCIVIVVYQPNKMKGDTTRAATGRDAKGSEALGSTANQFFILDRKRKKGVESCDESADPWEEITSVILDYVRDGKSWIKKLYFDGRVCTFYPLEGNYAPAEKPAVAAQSKIVTEGYVAKDEDVSF